MILTTRPRRAVAGAGALGLAALAAAAAAFAFTAPNDAEKIEMITEAQMKETAAKAEKRPARPDERFHGNLRSMSDARRVRRERPLQIGTLGPSGGHRRLSP